MHVGRARADEPAASATASAGASASISTSTAGTPASTAAAPPNQEDAPKEKSDPTARKVIAASAIGFGAIGLGIWVAQLARISPLRDEQSAALQSVPAGVDACSVSPSASYFAPARAACDREESIDGTRTSAWVAFGFGLALVTTGVVLLVTEKKENKSEPSKASWQFSPVVGPTTGFAATGTF
jgi:hypothetical protein